MSPAGLSAVQPCRYFAFHPRTGRKLFAEDKAELNAALAPLLESNEYIQVYRVEKDDCIVRDEDTKGSLVDLYNAGAK